METCKKCGGSLANGDCPNCKTVIGLNIKELPSTPVKFTCRTEGSPEEQPPAVLEAAATGCKLAVPIPVCKFGRDPECDISVEGTDAVSRLHFMITFEQGYFYIMDLGSTNGTMLHGKALTERTLLQDGAEIEIGPLQFRFVVNAVVDADGGYADFLKYLENHAAHKPPLPGSDLGMTTDCQMPDEARKVLDRIFHSQEQAQLEADQEVALELEDSCNGNGDETDWGPQYMQPELDKLQDQLKELHDIARATQKRIRDCEKKIAVVKGLRKALLTATGDDLIGACARVLTRLGWEGKRSSDGDKQEFMLTWEGSPSAIARVIWAEPEVAHLDLGKLVISQVAHWCRHRAEPKGLLILGSRPDKPATSDTAFSAELLAYAKEKNVCVVTTAQMLCMFKEVELESATPEEVRKRLMDTRGELSGFQLEVESPSAAV